MDDGSLALLGQHMISEGAAPTVVDASPVGPR